MRLTLAAMCALAAMAVTAPLAMAEAPEFGRCIKKAKAEGAGYSAGNCIKAVSKEALYEWVPGPGAKPKWTSKARFVYTVKYEECSTAGAEEGVAARQRTKAKEASEKSETELAEKLERKANEHQRHAEEIREHTGMSLVECEKVIEEAMATPVVLVTSGGVEVECGTVSGAGEYSGAKAVSNVTMTFTECAYKTSTKCTSSGAKAGEVSTATLQGELGVVKKEGTEVTRSGLDLAPTSGTVVAEFTCGEKSFVVTGSVIREVGVNIMRTEDSVTYRVLSKAKQIVEKFEGLPADVLTTSINGLGGEQTGLELTGTNKNEEAIEINAVV